MRELPMLCNTRTVQAILAGRQTQDRRPIKPQPKVVHAVYPGASIATEQLFRDGRTRLHSPYQVGDLLWVRETFSYAERACEQPVWYWADGNPPSGDWTRPKASIHMPKKYARLWLLVEGVRAERIQDISEEDAIAEGLYVQVGDGGAPGPGYKWTGNGYKDVVTRNFHVQHPPRSGLCCCGSGLSPGICAFKVLWDSLYAAKGYGWDTNCWVWAYDFKREER